MAERLLWKRRVCRREHATNTGRDVSSSSSDDGDGEGGIQRLKCRYERRHCSYPAPLVSLPMRPDNRVVSGEGYQGQAVRWMGVVNRGPFASKLTQVIPT